MTLLEQARELYRNITLALIENGLTITMMESCTSGLIASLITDTAGASAVMKGAFVTYSNEAKIMQGVPEETIRDHGVYSLLTAEDMARACRRAYGADIGIGVTGSINTVDPANLDSVPGEAYFAVSFADSMHSRKIVIPRLDRFESKLYIAVAAGEHILDEISHLKN